MGGARVHRPAHSTFCTHQIVPGSCYSRQPGMHHAAAAICRLHHTRCITVSRMLVQDQVQNPAARPSSHAICQSFGGSRPHTCPRARGCLVSCPAGIVLSKGHTHSRWGPDSKGTHGTTPQGNVCVGRAHRRTMHSRPHSSCKLPPLCSAARHTTVRGCPALAGGPPTGACHMLPSTPLHSAGSWPTRVGVAAVAAAVHGVALCVGIMHGSLSGAPQVGLGEAAGTAAKAAGSGCWSTGTERTHACTPRTKQQGAPAERKSKEEHT